MLVVNDEQSICNLAAGMLRRSGYRLLTASTGEEALAIFRARQAPIDLVLLDLNMPCMGGMACLESPQVIDPKLKVVVASG